MNRIVILLVLCLTPFVSAVSWSDCGSKTGKVADVQVLGCEGTPPRCILKRGSNVTFSIKFKPGVNTTTLSADVHGIISGVPIPFDTVQKDACTKCGLQCPLVADKLYEYSTPIEILAIYPPIDVDVKWELQDDSKKDTVCVMVPATLK